jgi:hypothetical protein
VYSPTSKTFMDCLKPAMTSAMLLMSAGLFAAEPEETKPEENLQSCRRLVETKLKPLQELWEHFKLASKLAPDDPARLLKELGSAHCETEESKRHLLSVLANVTGRHGGKVAVFIPMTNTMVGREILSGIQASSPDAFGVKQGNIIIFDSSNYSKNDKLLLADLSNALFQHKVSAVIGGYERETEKNLTLWAEKLLVPAFILNTLTSSPAKPLKFTYYIHPTLKELAKKLVLGHQRYQHKKVSILRPNDNHMDGFTHEYVSAAQAAGITILQNVVYDPRRVDSMESAARKLFKLEPNDRRQELNALYDRAKKRAANNGVAFNPKMVALQPIVDQDAIGVFDQFKNTRHMAKILSYLGVRKIPLFGTFEWRSIGLVDPFDLFLSSSYFVDFIGRYNNLPRSLGLSPLEQDSNFLPPDQVEVVDLRVIGFRAGQAASTIVPFSIPGQKFVERRKLDRTLKETFKDHTELKFDEKNQLIWPAHLFEVTGSAKTGTIKLIDSN